MTDITMPRLSEQMEHGTIVSWLVEDGQQVEVGDELVEIETDKATMAYAAEVDGVVEIVAEVGVTLSVGEVMARIGDATAAADGNGAGRAAEDVVAAEQDAAPAAPVAAASGNAAREPDSRRSNGDAVATPVAARMAGIHGIDLASLAGTGPLGRITKNDVLRAAGIEAPAPTAPAPTAPGPAAPGLVGPAPAAHPAPSRAAEAASGERGETTIVEPSSLERVVARRMAEATATIPHFQVETDVAFDAAMELRATLKADGATVSLNDVIVFACARALRSHPRVNASYAADRFELHSRINIGIAVATDDGLLVVTVPDADRKSLGELAEESRRLSERARSGEITPPELAGATFTISNLGMYGMTAITPVINPPQAAILGVGSPRSTLARTDDGQVTERQLLTLRLSADHRILNGADAARFLSDVRSYLEHPLRLLV
jgi:pyruvate dehydrogenase E2 component (dihydrolipoamide acetyltransferase)